MEPDQHRDKALEIALLKFFSLLLQKVPWKMSARMIAQVNALKGN